MVTAALAEPDADGLSLRIRGVADRLQRAEVAIGVRRLGGQARADFGDRNKAGQLLAITTTRLVSIENHYVSVQQPAGNGEFVPVSGTTRGVTGEYYADEVQQPAGLVVNRPVSGTTSPPNGRNHYNEVQQPAGENLAIYTLPQQEAAPDAQGTAMLLPGVGLEDDRDSPARAKQRAATAKINKEAAKVCREWLDYFADKTGRKRGSLLVNEPRLVATKRILSEGFALDDIRVVIWSKVHGPRKWLGDEEMDKYLTPETLVRRLHFTKYLEQAREEYCKFNPARAKQLGWYEKYGEEGATDA
jgi:uncharacterized phage protein (TIGR02220 family)